MNDIKHHPIIRMTKFFLLTGFIFTSIVVFSQSSSNYTIQKFVLAQGSDVSTSTNYTISDCIGQPSPVGDMTSPNYGVNSGYLGIGLPGTGVAYDPINAIPKVFKLEQNYPNPFNPVTTIEYDIPNSAEVILSIFDLKGAEVIQYMQGILSAGRYSVQWKGIDDSGNYVASGIYFYRITAKSKNKTYFNVKKMIFIK